MGKQHLEWVPDDGGVECVCWELWGYGAPPSWLLSQEFKSLRTPRMLSGISQKSCWSELRCSTNLFNCVHRGLG